MSNFNIDVTYGDHTKLFSCSSRREFGSKVSKFFGVDRSELQLFEINKNSRNPISLNDLKDQMKIEVRKNGIPPIAKANGERPGPAVEAVKIPDISALKQKLIENRVLSGSERKFLLQLTEDFSDSISAPNKKRKRDFEDNENEKKTFVNKKVQVDSVVSGRLKDYATQTDPLLTHESDKPSESSRKDLITESKLLARSDKKDLVKVRKLMDETFEERRQFILLKSPVLLMVKEKYPLLFSTEEVRNELNRIFYDKKDEEFLSNVKVCTKAILDLIDEDNPLAKIINEAIQKANTPSQKSYAKQVGALLVISNIMREKRQYLSTIDEPSDKNMFPRIEAPCKVSEMFQDVNTFRIIVEGVVLCEPTSFPEAVLCLLSCYFIFNISYPDKTFNTFVLMEKIFLDANDTDANEIDENTSQIIRLIKLKTNAKS